MSIPSFNIYTMSPCLYHESFPISRVIVHTMSPVIYITKIQQSKTSTQINENLITEIHLSEVQNYQIQEYRNTNYRNTKIKMSKIQTGKLQKKKKLQKSKKKQSQKYRNTKYRNIEIQIKEVQKHRLQEYSNYINQCQNFGVCLHIDFISITTNIDLQLEGGVIQKDIENFIRMKQI